MPSLSRWSCAGALAMALLSAGCATGTGAEHAAAAAVQAGSPAARPFSPGFTVSGAVARPMRFDLAALRALPASTRKAAGGDYTGVDLWALLDSTVGLRPEPGAKDPSVAMYAVATGSDGYRAVFSLAEIDPAFGHAPALVAYALNGAPMDRNGMARLVFPADGKMGRAVSSLTRIEVFIGPAGPRP